MELSEVVLEDNMDVRSGLVVDGGSDENTVTIAEGTSGVVVEFVTLADVVGDCCSTSSCVGLAVSEIVVSCEGCASAAAVVTAEERLSNWGPGLLVAVAMIVTTTKSSVLPLTAASSVSIVGDTLVSVAAVTSADL